MKVIIDLDDTDHNFGKVNLITSSGGYDTYRCKCGLEGKRHTLGSMLQVTGKKSLIEKCPFGKAKEPTNVKRVKIENFTGHSTEFANLTRGSEHNVVPCPEEHIAKYGEDVWVMGMSEPVRLLSGEYSEVK